MEIHGYFYVARKSKVLYSAVNRMWCITPESLFDGGQKLEQKFVLSILIRTSYPFQGTQKFQNAAGISCKTATVSPV